MKFIIQNIHTDDLIGSFNTQDEAQAFADKMNEGIKNSVDGFIKHDKFIVRVLYSPDMPYRDSYGAVITPAQ